MQVFTRQAVTAMIAYTNLLHIQSGNPTDIRREDPETWNQQITYAETLLKHMEKTGFVQRTQS